MRNKNNKKNKTAHLNPADKSHTKYKKKKQIVPEEKRPIICPPDKAGMSLRVRVLGYICRAAITFTAVFGLVFFLCDALKLEAQELIIEAKFIALVSLVSVSVFSLMRLSKYSLAGGSLFIVGVLAWIGISVGDVFTFVEKVLITAKNVALTRLYNLGYYTMSKYITEISYSAKYSREFYFKYAIAAIVVLLSLAFVLSALKRVRVAVPAIMSIAILGVVFTYNISRSNWGTVIIIASFAGLIVMAAYDRLFTVKADNEKYDTNTILFEDDERPKIPEGISAKTAGRILLREKKREFREIKQKHRKDKSQITVDEELTNYFSNSVKQKNKTSDEKRKKLTREERKTEKSRQREILQQIRTVKNYDRAVGDSRAAQGGFAAVGAFVLAMLMLLGPALTVSSSFSTIEVIDKKMEYYREYVTALLMGDDPILDELGYQNDKNNFEPHSTTAHKQTFTGAKLFTVETQYNTSVYLRGWIGTDYANGAWLPANDEQLDAYRALYNTYLDPTETMFRYFYTFMNPELIEDVDFSTKINSNTKYGFVAMQVNIDRVETGDSLVYMPAFYRVNEELTKERQNAGHGLYEYGTSNPLDTTFVNYFDGIYTGRKFMSELKYASVSYVTTMKINDWYKNVAKYIAEYNKGYSEAYNEIEKYAERKARGRNATFDDVIAAMFTEAPDNVISVTVDESLKTKTISVQYERGIVEYVYDTETLEEKSRKITDRTIFTTVDPVTGEITETTYAFTAPDLSLTIRFRELMTLNDKRALAYAYYYQYMYTDFVYNTYTDNANSKIITDMFDTILSSSVTVVRNSDDEGNVTETEVVNDYSKAAEKKSDVALTYEQRHELIMAIVDYFKENYTYTLEPTAVADASLDGVENFLTVTKEGYCVQFASSLALLLREAGIPARYVEGYVAGDFNRNYSPDAVGNNIATVRDWHAHAWVEVFYDGIGWIQYEATPVYYDDMYVRYPGESGGGTRPWDDTGDEQTEEELLLESLKSSIDSAEILLQAMKDKAKLLIGGREVIESLNKLEPIIKMFGDNWDIQNDYYTVNKESDDYDRIDYISGLNSFALSIENKITNPLYYQLTRVEGIEAENRVIWTIVGIFIIAIALTVTGIIIDVVAKKAEKKRLELTKRIIAGDFSDEEKTTLARSLIDWLTALISAYGSAPLVGEFRDEYADRLTTEYSDIFGRAKDSDTSTITMPSELISDTDFRAIFNSIAANEFGYGMTDEELIEVAKFYLRMRSGIDKHMKLKKRIINHYIKKII